MTDTVWSDLDIAGITAPPGTKRYAWLTVTEVWNGPFTVPLVMAHGRHPGRRLLLLAMHHGDEYDGFTSAHRLLAELDPEKMHGSVVSIPCLNVPAFLSGARQSIFDGLDLNRVHPGKERGFFAEQIAHFVTTRVIPGADCVIDLHGGNLNLQVVPYVGYGAWDRRALDLARATAIPNLYPINEDRLQNTLGVTSRALGVPHLNVEAGGGLWGDEEIISTMVRAIRNVLRALEIMSGTLDGLPERYFLRRSNMISSTTGGFFYAHVALGQRVPEGHALGRVVNLLNQEIETIVAPAAGFVQDLKTTPRVWPGDWLVLLGEEEQAIS